MIAAAASLALAVVLLDVASVAVLLPAIRVELGSSSSGAAWVVAAHLLALAALLPVVAAIAGGGRGRAYAAAGAVLMIAGAVTGATAGSTAALVGARALQGAGAAALLGSLAGAPHRRAALVLPALALALGPLAGGVFAELNWWHVYFWAGVPLAAVAAVPALAATRSQNEAPGARELTRRLALAAGLTAITIALIQGEDWSWGWQALLLLAGAVFIRAARPRGPGPLAATAAVACGCLAALVFLMPEYFELVRRLSGLRSGVVLLALTVPAVAGWAISRAARTWPPELPVVAAGALGAAAGLAVLITLEPRTAYAVSLGALALVGGGLGVAAGAVRGGHAPTQVVGWAAAGAALGLASAAASFQAAQAEDRAAGASFEQALAAGVGWAAVCLLFLLVACGLLAWRVRPASSAAPPAAASSPPPHRPA